MHRDLKMPKYLLRHSRTRLDVIEACWPDGQNGVKRPRTSNLLSSYLCGANCNNIYSRQGHALLKTMVSMLNVLSVIIQTERVCFLRGFSVVCSGPLALEFALGASGTRKELQPCRTFIHCKCRYVLFEPAIAFSVDQVSWSVPPVFLSLKRSFPMSSTPGWSYTTSRLPNFPIYGIDRAMKRLRNACHAKSFYALLELGRQLALLDTSVRTHRVHRYTVTVLPLVLTPATLEG